MDFSNIVRLKGEVEAEGLTRDGVAAEAAFAARNGLPYLVKIGGCEARSDMRFLMSMGIRSIVAPMIESPFAMSKYQDMLPDGTFDHIGVTIETTEAVRRIDEILIVGPRLSEVTVGGSDLTASFDGSGVDSAETVAMVKTAARAARAGGVPTTVGGAINAQTIALLRQDDELRNLVNSVETRKCVMLVDRFLEAGALEAAFAIEGALLDMQLVTHGAVVDAARQRSEILKARA